MSKKNKNNETIPPLHDGHGIPLGKMTVLIGGVGQPKTKTYGKSPVASAIKSLEEFNAAAQMAAAAASSADLISQHFADATDEKMMSLYKKTHPEEFVDCVDTPGEEETMMEHFNLAKLKSAKTVPLMEAEKLYQPVRGTSSGSRYFVLAIGPKLRVAGRWMSGGNGHGLALRVEGPGLEIEETKALVSAVGLDFKSPTHASVHLSSTSEIEILKAVGALLFGLDQEWTTTMPNPHTIEGI